MLNMSLREPLFARTGSASDFDTACDKYKASSRGRVTMETKSTNVVIENIMNSNRTFTESIAYSLQWHDVTAGAPFGQTIRLHVPRWAHETPKGISRNKRILPGY